MAGPCSTHNGTPKDMGRKTFREGEDALEQPTEELPETAGSGSWDGRRDWRLKKPAWLFYLSVRRELEESASVRKYEGNEGASNSLRK